MGIFDFFKKKDKLPKFKVGDKVICVDDRKHGNGEPPHLIYRKEYEILDITQCVKCKAYCYDVGLKSDKFTECDDECKFKFPVNNIHWAGEFRFEKGHTEEKKEENKKSENLEMEFTTKKIIEEAVILKN